MTLSTVSQYCAQNCITPAYTYIEHKWVSSEDTIDSELLARIGYCWTPYANFGARALDAIAAVGCAFAVIFTGGTYKPAFQAYHQFTHQAFYLFADPFAFMLKTAKPKLQFPDSTKYLTFKKNDSSGNVKHYSGLISRYLQLQPLWEITKACLELDNPWLREGLSRLIIGGITLVRVVANLADTAIGILAAAFALITLGYFDTLNVLAFRCLQSPVALFSDLALGITYCVNPWAIPDEAIRNSTTSGKFKMTPFAIIQAPHAEPGS